MMDGWIDGWMVEEMTELRVNEGPRRRQSSEE